jgi:hypothetical protein
LIEGVAFEELVADVRQFGVRESVVLTRARFLKAATVTAPRARLARSGMAVRAENLISGVVPAGNQIRTYS